MKLHKNLPDSALRNSDFGYQTDEPHQFIFNVETFIRIHLKE